MMGLFDKNNSSPWVYFLAGALLPTLAWWMQYRREEKRIRDDDDDDDDSDDNESEDGFQVPVGASCQSWGLQHAPYKMVLIVNQELGMGKGKIAAQCGHAAVACYKRAAKVCPSGLAAWERTGCAKIALKCPTQEEMEMIAGLALSKDIPCYLVEDAGRTQIAAGSRTVLGCFGPVSVFQGVTDHLKLM
jgi:PTH2 family peptidyl-tRNA hydrolase